MFVHVDVDTDEYVIDPEEDSDEPYHHRGSRGLSISAVRVRASHQMLGVKAYGYEIDAVPGDLVFVLIEKYSDGDTFGSAEYTSANGVYKTSNDAHAAIPTEKPDHGYFGHHVEWYIEAAVVRS